MNRNTAIMLGAFVVIIFLIAGGYMYLNKEKGVTGQNSVEKKNSLSPFTSIKDALTKSMSLKCDYTDKNGTRVVVNIKNGMVRSDVTGTTSDKSGSVIIKDKKMYYWNAQGGFVMTMPELTVTPGQGGSTTSEAESTLATLEQYKDYCKQASVNDSLFVLPTNIKFQDMSVMMPSGVAAPSNTQAAPTGMSKQQIEEMMKKYQQAQ